MYLTEKKLNGHIYVYLYESYRGANGKPNSRIHKSYGRRDKLDPAVYEELKQKYGNSSVKRQAEIDRQIESFNDLVKRVNDNNEPIEREEKFSKLPIMRYGHLLLKPLWDMDIGMRYKLDRIQSTKTDITAWSLNKAVFHLVSSRLIDPGSYLSAFQHQTSLLDNPAEGIALDNYYRCLDLLAEHKDDIMQYLGKRLRSDRVEGAPSLLMYDCTNFYFETPYDDLEQFMIRHTKKIKAQLMRKGTSPEAAEELVSNALFQESLRKLGQERDEFLLRRRGASKEQRFSQPIVSMAFVVDDRGMPLDFEIFKGNCSEFKTMKPVIEKLSKKYNIKNSFITADRGLNSTANLKMLLDNKLGFIVAQKVTNLRPADQSFMLDQNGYTTIEAAGVTADDNSEHLRYKVGSFLKTTMVHEQGQPKKTKIEVHCKILYTFSEKRRKRDLAELDDDVTKAKTAVREGRLMGNPCASGWRQFVQTAKEKAENKKDKEMFRAVGVKEDVIKQRRLLAGYAAVVYSASPSDTGSEIDPETIIRSYRYLLQLEDNFRRMKHNLLIRPMFVRLHQRIKGHCVVCVIALGILRLLEEKIKKTGVNWSPQNVLDALKNATVIALPGGSGEPLFISGRRIEDALTLNRVKPTAKRANVNELMDIDAASDSYIKDIEAHGDEIDALIKVVGLKPLLALSSAEYVRRALKIKTSSAKLLGSIASSILSKVKIAF